MIRTTLRLLALLVAAPVLAAVPGEIQYQGLLLDAGGSPRNGSADFVFSLFDVDAGGSALWTETHDGVPVLDGVYDVVLGSTTPITPSLVSGGVLHLEIQVDGETLVPRQRLLAVPYAVRADHAESADTVQGTDGAYLVEIVENFDFDGSGLANTDPREGLADTDSDGSANFIDSDNDGDGLLDFAELAQGSDINLVTPTVTGFAPEPVEASVSSAVQVQGTNFEPGLSVVFGSESPVPQNLTPTSFDVDVGPQAEGSASVVVTRSNGQSSQVALFDFVEFQPQIASLSPSAADALETTVVTVTGSGFAPGLEVSFGSESPVPQNLTSTGFQVSVGPQTAGLVQVVASYPSGKQDSAAFEFLGGPVRTAFVSSATYNGNLGGVSGADSRCQTLADAASLSGTFLAWLGDATTEPASRFSGGTYRTTNGALIAGSFQGLTDGTLDVPIGADENGDPVGALVWSNVDPDGTAGDGPSCSDWTTSGGTGAVGVSNQTDSDWTDSTTVNCGTSQHLYCFEQ